MVAMNKGIKYSVAEGSHNGSKLRIITLTAVVLVAFLIRMLSYASITANGGITFRGYDQFYHMRRILYTAYNFPHTLNFDSYLNYPYGFKIGWPPFFDLLGALLAKILGGGQPDLHTIEFAGALLPVFLGVLTIIPLYIAAATIFDRKTGLFAAFIFAFIPAHIYASKFGNVSHHVAETFLTTAAYTLLILALKWAREGSFSPSSLKNIYSGKKLMKSLAFAGASGIFLALFIFTWLGALFFVSLIVLYAVIQTTIDLKAEKRSDDIFICLIANLFATLLFTIPLSAGYVRSGLEMSAMYLSWFQALYVLSMIAVTTFLWGLSIYLSKKDIDWKYYPGTLILVLFTSFLLLRVFSAGTYAFVIEGISFFSGKGTYLGTISEAIPLFLTSTGNFTVMQALENFGLCLLVSLAAFFLLVLEWKRDESKPERVFFLLWTIFSAYITFSQRRFSYQLAVNIAILTSYILWVMFESLNFEIEVKKVISELKNGNKISLDSQAGKKINVNTTQRLKKRDFSEPKNNQRPDYVKVFLALALIGLVFVPCIMIGAALAKSSDWVGPDPEWQKSLIWLQNSSPETSYYLQPSQIPEYGVLSWWDYGNWIVYISKRPAISNNFQTGVEDSAYFFMSESEQEAKVIMDKLKVKYVITDTPMLNEKFGAIAHFAGKDSKDYFKQVNRTSVIGKEKLLNTEIFKLHDQNGANLGNLRLVHESNVFNVGHNKGDVVKIFEYVPGAKITGTSSPHKLVNVTLYLKSNTGRKFKYENKAMADMNGSFEITVPYSTEEIDSGINAISAYKLSAGKNITEPAIYIKESDVLNGNRIKI